MMKHLVTALMIAWLAWPGAGQAQEEPTHNEAVLGLVAQIQDLLAQQAARLDCLPSFTAAFTAGRRADLDPACVEVVRQFLAELPVVADPLP